MEDDELLRDLLKRKLEKEGYDILAVSDGEEGLKVVKDYQPDLLLLDVLMPKVDGFEVLKRLKEDKALSSIPTMIISNSGQPVEIKKALEMGVVDYIVKADFDPEEVVQKVQKFFFGSEPEKKDGRKIDIEEYDSSTESTNDNGNSEHSESENKEEISEKKARKTEGEKVKILLVEDDDFLRNICQKKLEKEGFNVSIAEDGNEALKKVMENDFHLILLDIILPGQNGFDVLEKIKSNPSKSSIPVVMLTNLGQRSEIEKGLKLGAEDYIIKAHFTVGEIVAKVKEILERKSIAF